MSDKVKRLRLCVDTLKGYGHFTEGQDGFQALRELDEFVSSMESPTRENLNLDISDGEEARALHRVVRAMHDGHCPNCGYLGPSDSFVIDYVSREGHECPGCLFFVSVDESEAALKAFSPYMNRSVRVFARWRLARNQVNAGD